MGKLVWRNLLRDKRRTAFTLVSLAMALALLAFLTSFLNLLRSAESAADNRIVVRSAVSLATLLPEAYEPRLEEIDAVEEVTPLTWFNGVYKDQRPENFFPRFASDPETVFDVYTELEIPPEQLATWQAERTAFVAGEALAEAQGWELGDRITIRGDLYPADLDLTLRGVFTSPEQPSQENQMFFHRRYLEEALGNPGLVGTYIVRVDSADAVPDVIRRAEERFANSEAQVRAETEAAFQLAFLEMLGDVRSLFGAIGLAVIVSIFFVVSNTMAMAARERVREVAVLKTLGFRRGHVLTLVLGESVAVGLLGALVGCGLAALVIGAASGALSAIFPVFGTFAMAPEAWVLGLGTGLLVGLLSGLVPGLLAARLDIVDALRRVA